jgi:drug/metabolite transporter (DMT)-like permease
MAGPAALALLAAVQFGLALVLTQFALRHGAPGRGARASIATSALVLGAVALARVDPAGFSLRGAAVFAAVGLVFPVAVTRLTFEANRLLGPSLAGALGNLAPLFAVLGAVLLFGAVPSMAQGAGLGLVVAGVAAISLRRGAAGRRLALAAVLLPLAAAALRGFVQPATQAGLAFWPSPLAAAAIGYAVSVAVAFALPVAAGPRLAPAGRAWFAAVGLCNGGAVLTLYAALAAGPVLLVAPLVATYPLVTLALSALLPGGTGLTRGMLGGIAGTVAGVMLLLAG